MEYLLVSDQTKFVYYSVGTGEVAVLALRVHHNSAAGRFVFVQHFQWLVRFKVYNQLARIRHVSTEARFK